MEKHSREREEVGMTSFLYNPLDHNQYFGFYSKRGRKSLKSLHGYLEVVRSDLSFKRATRCPFVNKL